MNRLKRFFKLFFQYKWEEITTFWKNDAFKIFRDICAMILLSIFLAIITVMVAIINAYFFYHMGLDFGLSKYILIQSCIIPALIELLFIFWIGTNIKKAWRNSK